MKKIMKKAVSLALALVMMLSLAPMSAMAAPAATPTGTGTAVDPYVLTADGTTYMVVLEKDATVFVSTGEVYNATINGVAATGEYSFLRGKTDYNPVVSVDGVASITLEESNMVMLRNLSEDVNAVYLNAAAGEGGAPVGTWDSPEIVEFVENEWRPGVFGANLQTELEEGNQGYYYQYTATEDGAISISVDAAADLEYSAPMGWMYQVTNVTKSIQSDMHWSDDEEVVYSEIVPVSVGDVLEVFVATYDPANMWNNPAGVVFVNFGALSIGSSDYPQAVVEGDYSAVIKENAGEYYYVYKATESGKLSVTINTETGWSYSLYNLTSWAMSDYHTSADEEVVVTDGINVVAGDEVQITIGTFDPNSPWSAPAGTIDWTLSFVPGEVEDDGSGDSGDVDDDVVEEEKEPFYQDEFTVLELGEQWIILDLGYETTLFEFFPASTGTYTFTLDDEDATIGYYGSNMWFPYHDGSEMTNTVTVNYPEVGGPIVIGVSNTAIAILTIERTGDAQVVEKAPEWMLSVSAQPYIFNGNVDDLAYVDIEDKLEDKAVYSVSDGYYHLNTVDGPILLVSLLDDVLALGKATATGKIAIATYNEAGEVIGIWNCNNAMDLYVANADAATGLYPLTAELMYIYQNYGEQQKWYDKTGFIGSQFNLGNAADAWMFACMYIPNAEDGSIVVPPVVVAPEVNDKGEVDITDEEFVNKYEDAVTNNKDLVIYTTAENVTITFNGSDLKDIADFNLNVEVVIKEDVTDETVAKNDKITADNFVLKIEFSHEGPLPAEAVITIPVPYTSTTLYYYEILADGTLKYICDAPVDANGNAKVTQSHCSAYVLLNEKIVEEAPKTETPETPEAPKTGDATNVALWVAVLGLGVVAIAGSVVMKKREF